ncbi:hypothetical protein CXT96_06180 [Akkermansia muciniphila]|nr:hypothetical protein CXT92_12320 [Akkermansia muciniphila]PNC93033.1 hypothetical protein CXT91_01280 [Akkermansia muciniphila]PND16489.1 hypothetical protein CXT96_06180 [Akkermansia muciniphila]
MLRLPGTLGTLGFRNPSVFSSRLAPETSQMAAGQSWSPYGKKLINSGSYLNLPRLPGSRKGGEREKFLFALREKQGREGRKSAMPSWIIFVNHGNLFLSKLLKIRFVAVYAR